MKQPSHDPSLGARKAGDSYFPDIWVKLHRLARGWSDLWQSDDIAYERSNIDRSTIKLLKQLSAVPANEWCAFCAVAGWTSYGAIAASWCADATLDQVWHGWISSGALLVPEPASERPALLLCPKLLSRSASLTQIVNDADNVSLGICALIVALDAPIVLDVPVDHLEQAPPQVAAFLLSRSEALEQRDDIQKLYSVWRNTILGTEYALGTEPAQAPIAVH